MLSLIIAAVCLGLVSIATLVVSMNVEPGAVHLVWNELGAGELI